VKILLGVIVPYNLKSNKDYLKAFIKAKKLQGMIKRSFCVLSKQLVLRLYESSFEPHVGIGSTALKLTFRKE
jgi:hypothetical protein